MRVLLISLMMLAALQFAWAGDGCGSKAGGCGGCGGAKTAAVTAAPDCAPSQVKALHTALLPMAEARQANDDALIRAKAAELRDAAKGVSKAEQCCPEMEMKSYKKAAKQLARDAKALEKVSKKGTTDQVLAQMKVVEDDFAALCTHCK